MGLGEWVRGWFGRSAVPAAPEPAAEGVEKARPAPARPEARAPKPVKAAVKAAKAPGKPKKPNKGKNRRPAEIAPVTPPAVVTAAPVSRVEVEEAPPPLPVPLLVVSPKREATPRPPPRKQVDQDTLAWVVVPKLEALLAETDQAVAAEPPDRKVLLDARSRLEREWQALLPIPAAEAPRLTGAYRDRSEALRLRIEPLPDPRAIEEAQNLARRQALVAEAEALAAEPDLTAAVNQAKALQRAWRDAPRIARAALAEEAPRFEAAMDAVFARRDTERAERVQKLGALVDQAETLTRSKDPARAAEAVKRLQARWKETGGVRGEEGDALWTRFRAAADLVFERRRTTQVASEQANLESREALIAEALARAAEGVTDPDEVIRQLQARWKRIGHVARERADPTWTAFKSACDQLRAPPRVDPEALGDGDGALRFSPFGGLDAAKEDPDDT